MATTMQAECCLNHAHHVNPYDKSLQTVLLANAIRKRKRNEWEANGVSCGAVSHEKHKEEENNKRPRLPTRSQPIGVWVKFRQHFVPKLWTGSACYGPHHPAYQLPRQRPCVGLAQPVVVLTTQPTNYHGNDLVPSSHTIEVPATAPAALLDVQQEEDVLRMLGMMPSPYNSGEKHLHSRPQHTEENCKCQRMGGKSNAYDLYFSRESLEAVIDMMSNWIYQNDERAYNSYKKEERERFVISLVQSVVKILNWRLSSFLGSYSQCFRIDTFPNMFSKNFKVDTSRLGIDKLAKKWQKRNYELLLATLIYADRYVHTRGLREMSLDHILVISSLCTAKHWLEERNRHSNRLFAELLRLSVKDVNALERTFLSGLNYSLSLSTDDFPRFLLYQMRPYRYD